MGVYKMYGVFPCGVVMVLLSLLYVLLYRFRNNSLEEYRLYLEGFVAHTEVERRFVHRRLDELHEMMDEEAYQNRLVVGSSLAVVFFTVFAVVAQACI